LFVVFSGNGGDEGDEVDFNSDEVALLCLCGLAKDSTNPSSFSLSEVRRPPVGDNTGV